MKKMFLSILFVVAATLSAVSQTTPAPKREMRGAWIQMINGQFQGMTPQQMRDNLTRQLDVLASCGVNTIIFQVRGEADALYASPYEPWSRFLTGTQGQAPAPLWDPLQWMVGECHRRGMELHAWINPYRAKTKGTARLAKSHPYVQHPERFFEYDGLLLFDPGIDANRHYICEVAADIVRRYDIDGLHIDDYFYPYPAAGKAIPDATTYAAHRNGFDNIDDWRRYNVNLFIEELHRTIRETKPWVKFGVSPFGIYHNHKDGSRLPGSKTSGLQNYDDLYADVLYWIEKGWVDYVVPQLYWEIGHKAADYEELIKWWNRYAARRPLIVGQDVERTVRAGQTAEKMRLQRTMNNVKGSCMWYSAAVVRNEGGFADALRQTYHATPALQPLMPYIDDKAPGRPQKLKAMWMPDGFYLFWTAPKARNEMDRATRYAVYRFAKGEKIALDDASHLVAVTSGTFLKLPYDNGRRKYTYIVTALDRLHNESKASRKNIKL